MTPVRTGVAAKRMPRTALVLLALLIAASPAAADWPATGRSIMIPTNSSYGTRMVRFLDVSPADLTLMGVGRGGLALGYSVQRVRSNGDLPPEWAVDGTGLIVGGDIWEHGFAMDDSGCVWHAHRLLVQSRAAAQMVRPDALPLPSSNTGWLASTQPASPAAMAVASAPGGAYVAWGGKIQRMTRSGATAAGWSATGVTTGFTSTIDIAAIPDGAGGAIVFSPFAE